MLIRHVGTFLDRTIHQLSHEIYLVITIELADIGQAHLTHTYTHSSKTELNRATINSPSNKTTSTMPTNDLINSLNEHQEVISVINTSICSKRKLSIHFLLSDFI